MTIGHTTSTKHTHIDSYKWSASIQLHKFQSQHFFSKFQQYYHNKIAFIDPILKTTNFLKSDHQSPKGILYGITLIPNMG